MRTRVLEEIERNFISTDNLAVSTAADLDTLVLIDLVEVVQTVLDRLLRDVLIVKLGSLCKELWCQLIR